MKKFNSFLIIICAVFVSTLAQGQLPEVGKMYKVRNAIASEFEGTNLYIGKESPDYAGIVTSGVGDEFLLAQISTDTFNLMQISSGRYLTRRGGWDGVYAYDFNSPEAQFTVNLLDGDTCSIKLVANSAFIGSDATADGSSIYLNKGIENNGKWIFEEVIPDGIQLEAVKGYLQVEVDAAQALIGAYGATETENLNGVEGTISGITDWSEIGGVALNVHHAITAYKKSLNLEVVEVITEPEEGVYYNVLHSSLNFLSQGETNAFIMANGNPDALSQTFRFETVPGEAGTYYIRSSAGKYLAYNGYNSIWTSTSGENSKITISLSTDEQYITIKFVGLNHLAPDGNNDGDRIWTDKSGTDIKHMWNLIPVGYKIIVVKVINDANTALSQAVAGTGIGQHPQQAIDSMQQIIDETQALVTNNADDALLKEAVITLNGTLDWFGSQEITFASTYVGKDLYVIHSGGNLLSKIMGDTILVPQLRNLGVNYAFQKFEFEAATGGVGYVVMKSEDDKYLAFSGGWNTYWSDSIADDTKLTLGQTDDGYITIKFVNKSFLGTNGTGDGEYTYSDKGSTSLNSKWFIQEPGASIKIKLFTSIESTNLLLSNSEAGTELFLFPALARTALETKLAEAEGVYNDGAASQSSVDNILSELNSAYKVYLAAQIIPTFSPEPGTKYLVTNRQYTGFVNHNSTKAIFEQNVPLEGWGFVHVDDTTFVLTSGDLALAQSMNMVPFDAGAADQQWNVHYEGAQQYGGMYVPTTELYFSFSKAHIQNGMQATSSSMQIAVEHSHNSWAQWFSLQKIGAPITDYLETVIAEVGSTLSSTTVGTSYGQYAQEARDSLESVLADAQVDLLNTSLTQTEINGSADFLAEVLLYYKNQKVVWMPEEGMGYFLHSKNNTRYLSLDTADITMASAFELNEISYDQQLWFLIPVVDQAGYYYIINRNQELHSSGYSVSISELDYANATRWEVVFREVTNGVNYFNIVAYGDGNHNLSIGTTVGNDRFPDRESFIIELQQAGAFKVAVFNAQDLLSDANVGNGLGQYPQGAFDAFKVIVDESYTVALNPDATEGELQTKLDELKTAEETFRGSVTGSNFNLTELNVAVDEAQRLLETTEIIGSGAGECPQPVYDALSGAITTAITVEGGLDQAGVDARAVSLNEAVVTFVTDLKISTGLSALIDEATSLHENAVEGTLPGQYAVGSKAVIEQMITDAQTAFEKELVKQENLISAAIYLQAAIDEFNAGQVPSVDMQDLQDFIDLTDEFLAEAQPGEHVDLRTKVQEAKDVVYAGTATQVEVDALTIELLNAYSLATDIQDVWNKQVKVYAFGQTLFVKGLPEACDIRIYNMKGQIITVVKGVNDTYSTNLKTGHYVVLVKGRKSQRSTIVTVK